MDLDHLLSQLDDAKLCDDVFCAVAKAAGANFDTSTLDGPSKIICLVWHSAGIIGANGFENLLEGEFLGDPGYVTTCQAYGGIDASNAHSAFMDFIALFPNRKLPLDRRLRIEAMNDIDGGLRHAINERFLLAEGEVSACLARFIRTHEPYLRVHLQSL
jgi:hypothetical protein